MGLNFSTTSATSVDTGVKFLVHAPPGYGKTMLCATMPNPCIISAEAGLLSLRPDNQKRVYGAALDIPVIEIATAKDLQEALTFFQSSAHAKDLNPCLDSLSEMAEVILASFKRSCKDPRQAYGLMNECMTACIRDFRDLRGKHVYFAAKQDADKDADGVVRRGPAMPGKQLTQNVGHFFDEVFALDIGDMGDANHTKYRFLRTQPNIQFQAKDRSGALLEIEEPNLTKIITKIRSSQS